MIASFNVNARLFWHWCYMYIEWRKYRAVVTFFHFFSRKMVSLVRVYLDLGKVRRLSSNLLPGISATVKQQPYKQLKINIVNHKMIGKTKTYMFCTEKLKTGQVLCGFGYSLLKLYQCLSNFTTDVNAKWLKSRNG